MGALGRGRVGEVEGIRGQTVPSFLLQSAPNSELPAASLHRRAADWRAVARAFPGGGLRRLDILAGGSAGARGLAGASRLLHRGLPGSRGAREGEERTPGLLGVAVLAKYRGTCARR